MAQCAGIDYAVSVFQGANKYPNVSRLTELLAKTLKAIADGEITDVSFERSGRENEPFVTKNRYKNISKEDYFEMISKKTAVLLKASCEAGGICAGGHWQEILMLGLVMTLAGVFLLIMATMAATIRPELMGIQAVLMIH